MGMGFASRGNLLECLRKGMEASMLQKGMRNRDKTDEVREARESLV